MAVLAAIGGGVLVHAENCYGCLIAIFQDSDGDYYFLGPITWDAMQAWQLAVKHLDVTTLDEAIREVKSLALSEYEFALDYLRDDDLPEDYAQSHGIEAIPVEIARLQLIIAQLKNELGL